MLLVVQALAPQAESTDRQAVLPAEGANAPAAVPPLRQQIAPESLIVAVIPCPGSSALTFPLIGHRFTPRDREAPTFSSPPSTRQTGSADGYRAPISIIGNEGLVGIEVVMGKVAMLQTALVTCSGQAYRIAARILVEEFSQAGALQMLMLPYMQSLITQIAQTVACSQGHSIEQQLCRWLLLSIDRLPANQPSSVAKELILGFIGELQFNVMEAITSLQEDGVIRCDNRQMEVLDRSALEKRTCACYGVVKRKSERLFSGVG
ncbi:Crp/Fnr family transcriptional regulator [Cupriavidus sp. CuC1]|uniref:Crp/Fnr family transcriptional regulator n=1 Tax=Cupriavidus sp. CuC1 TaxID=3373131 RepID=UPI0037D87BAC